ncbi:MAG: 50S ribosomal protein L4 [Candidatus Uhrbacteria bacterium GW2011_GWE2_40_58]|nr:MAG: 50S ribosomal protein L4 [Candidatus Uhrbacteria bacterium GW2011_GWF2_40_263]KKR67509.1 MAG: 50S ribosomal protein L4 [Candidatus Uhrbacteria bacterium GW2011_GWE2_40_58]OGL96436.1 MAG: 50S ribosomal protein L4 [Candidatus Uhrbacteria bacterium RIFOXYB2_FULL_41_18]HBK34843.1 50S ribosomal protein L4 [Candidatus Uhrbacteria bacterium]HCB55503.1 50S ribosomal protein L4 [Candidatus Uhrbacteria bacterium]
MAEVTLYKIDGTKAGSITLDDHLFNIPVSEALVHEAVVYQQANSRTVIAHTKGRGEVRGGGRKPWKQKGTGRARHGSRRSPIWVGGGITFGPTKERNFSTQMNRKARRKALAMVLTDKVVHEFFVAVEQVEVKKGKTKMLKELLSKLPVAEKKTLIVLDVENKEVARAAQNLPNVTTIPVNSLNIVDLLANEYVLISKQTIDTLTNMYKNE